MIATADFQWRVRVYYEDTDLAGVVYYANYLKFMERARTEWLRSLRVEQDKLLAEHGVLFVIASTALRYRKPARFNDLLCVSVRVSEQTRTSLAFIQEVTRALEPAPSRHTAQAELLCRGEVRAACVDAHTFRPRVMPVEISNKLASQTSRTTERPPA